MRLDKYEQFILEKFYKKISKGKDGTNRNERIKTCVSNILDFLSENDINNWNDFMRMSTFDREILNGLIDSGVKNMDELKEVRFQIRLELSDRKQLMEYKNELEKSEEYEKCALIVQKLGQK